MYLPWVKDKLQQITTSWFMHHHARMEKKHKRCQKEAYHPYIGDTCTVLLTLRPLMRCMHDSISMEYTASEWSREMTHTQPCRSNTLLAGGQKILDISADWLLNVWYSCVPFHTCTMPASRIQHM